MLFLSEQDVRRVLPMPDLIGAMERALDAYSSGRVTQPVRSVMEIAPHQAFLALMPAAIDAPAALGAKLVTVYPGNHARGLPSHLATIVLFDPESGALRAVLDGRYITEARTAAVSAVSVKFLSRPDAHVLGLVGSGVQAHSHLEAIARVRQLTDVRVWSPNTGHCEEFARTAEGAGYPVRPAGSAAEAVGGADLIVLATSSKTPVIADGDVAAGAHISAVGACRPDQREMPSALVARARVFVDSRAGALKEAGDILLPIAEGVIGADHIAGELGDVPAGRVGGRGSRDEVTVFKSLGMAVEDLAAAHLAVSRAIAQGLGREFDA